MASQREDEDCLLDYEEDMYDDQDVGSDSEEDLVFFLQDSDDDEEVEYVPKPTVREKSPIRQLDPSLVAKMEIENVGRLKWLERDTEEQEIVLSDRDVADYPFIGTSTEQTRERGMLTTRWIKNKLPVKVPVHYVKGGPSEIKFREKDDTLCNYVLNKDECPFGDACKFSHDIPMCKEMHNGKACMRPVCRFRHPQICDKKDCSKLDCTLYHLSRDQTNRLRGMKTRMCKNILKKDAKGKLVFEGTCPSGEDCKFAHSIAQIKEAVTECKKKEQCQFVKHALRANARKEKKSVYTNVHGAATICRKLHPNEAIANFIVRTSLPPTPSTPPKQTTNPTSNQSSNQTKQSKPPKQQKN